MLSRIFKSRHLHHLLSDVELFLFSVRNEIAVENALDLYKITSNTKSPVVAQIAGIQISTGDSVSLSILASEPQTL